MSAVVGGASQYPAVRRGRRLVLHAGGLELPRGGVVGLIGINGAGKSTLLMYLADVLRKPRRHSLQVQRIGYAPQHAGLPAWLKTEEIALLFGSTLDDLIGTFPGLLLDELRDVRAGAMSVGQKQALSIALALAADAPVVLLDEPFAPLDFRRRIGLSGILRRSHTERTVVLSTQSASELVDVCSRVAVLRDGRCVWDSDIEVLAGREDVVQTLEKRLLSLLDDESSRLVDTSGLRRPFACHPQ